jgi:hypothetical protein
MKSRRLKIAAIVILLIIAVGGYSLLRSDFSGQSVSIKSVYDYLKQAEHIRVMKMDYNETSQQIKTYSLIDSNDREIIDSFLNALIEQMKTADVETSFKAMEIFTPDFRVQLKCRRIATIDFIFYEGINAACLRNEDCFFFAKFDEDGAKMLKKYFEKPY